MAQNDKIQLFEDKRIRTAWDEEKENCYFSVVDVVAVLTDQPDSRHASTYWAVLKKRLNSEGANQLLTSCKQLKMIAADGKRRMTEFFCPESRLKRSCQKGKTIQCADSLSSLTFEGVALYRWKLTEKIVPKWQKFSV